MAVNVRTTWQSAAHQETAPVRMVTLTMSADKAYLALVRTAATQVGATLRLPPARLADLRLAVNEACACFMDHAARRDPDPFGMSQAPDAMEVVFDLHPGELRVTVRAAAGEGWPDACGLSWDVLRQLPAQVRAHAKDGLGELTLLEPLASVRTVPTTTPAAPSAQYWTG